MTDQLSLLPMLDDAEHPTWLLNGNPGIQNDCGVYVENVFRFREGNLSGVYVDIDLCVEGDFVLFEFDYFTGTYGCGHPLCSPCHECHRNNSAEFLAEAIFETFKNSVVPYDGNLTNYTKETKELLKLCKRACDRIAMEIKAMSELKSLRVLYKFDKWDLFFGDDEINKCKGTFVLYVVNNSLTFENWIKEEQKASTYTYGYFKCVWKEADK